MNTRTRVAAAALTFAVAFSAGIVGGARDYIFKVSGTTESASLFSSFTNTGNQLAGEGGAGGNYGGSPSPASHPSPSPSSNHQTQSQTQGRGGAAPSGRDSAMGGGTTGGTNGASDHGCGGGGCNGNSPTPNGGGTTNHQTQSQTQGRGGAAPSGRDPAMGGGTTGGTNGASDHGCGGGGCNGNSPTPGGNNSQPSQAQQSAQYAKDLADYKNPNAVSRTPSGIGATISSTFSALGTAFSNLMGGPAQPTITTHPGTINGLDGDQPTYTSPTLHVDDFRTPPSTVGSPTDDFRAPPSSLSTPGTEPVAPERYVTSAATTQALSTLKYEDNKLMDQAAKFRDHFVNKISTADSIVTVSEIRKTVAGECASHACSANERIAIANAIMNRLDVAAANKPTLDVHDVLDAFDANMQAENQRKGGVPDNKVYAKSDIGTENNIAGETALNAVLSGNLPSDMPDAVKNATNYHTLNTHPDWAKGVAETPYGPHTFSDANGATAAQVQVAKDKVAAGDIKAEISYYKGVYNSASPQAAKVQAEVNRSLTVAGRTINIVTRSTGVTQGPGIGQTAQPTTNTQTPAGPPQKTSLDDPKSSNIPSPADVRNFITARGWPANKPIDGQYAYRLSNIVARAEAATGYTAPSNYLSSTYRTPEEQAQIKATFTGKDLTYDGVTYHPDKNDPGYGGNLPVDKQWKAAWPGQSPHQYGEAVDTVSTVTIKDPQARKAADAINHYIQSHTPMHNAVQSAGIDPKTGLPPRSADPSLTGLERVTKDPNHVQISGFNAGAPHTMDKLDASIGADGAAVPDKKTPSGAAPAAGGGFLGGLTRNIPSLTDIKKSLTPSAATQKNLEFVSKLPTWMQNIVISIYTGKVGAAPTSNTESHGGSSTPFPVADYATTSRSQAQRTATPKVDVKTLPWWQEYQAKLNALKQNNQQQSI